MLKIFNILTCHSVLMNPIRIYGQGQVRAREMRNEARNKIKNQILKSFLDYAMEIEFYPIIILMKKFQQGSNIYILGRSCRRFSGE